MKQRLIYAAIAIPTLSVAVLGGFWVWRDAKDASTHEAKKKHGDPSAAGHRRVTAGRERMNTRRHGLTRTVAEVSFDRESQRAPVDSARDTAALSATEEPSSDPTPPSEEERRVYAASVFDAEAFDANWAGPAAGQLTEGLGALTGNWKMIGKADCRSSACRTEIEVEESQVNDFLIRVSRSTAWQGAGMAITGDLDASGMRKVTLYFARQGARLPEAPGH